MGTGQPGAHDADTTPVPDATPAPSDEPAADRPDTDRTRELSAPRTRADVAHEGSIATTQLTIERILRTIRQHLHVDVAYLSRLDENEQVVQVAAGDAAAFGLESGTSLPIRETYCARMLRGDIPSVVPDTVADEVTRSMELTERSGIGSYVGVPVRRSDGSLHGTLCCASREPDAGLTQRDAQFLRAVASLIADQIDRARSLTEERDHLREQVARFVDGDGFEVHLQPVVDLASGRVVGAEALGRFEDGAPPFTWFANAARLGVGVDLERTAMRVALEHLHGLPDDVYLSVNASPGTVLAGAVHDLLDDPSMSQIVVEITEHAAIEDYGEVTRALEPLLDRGVRLAIDDAGAGFASFRHVVQLSPDILKLDISLTREVAADPVQHSLAEMLALFADRIDASVVAEGIETADVLRELRRIDVGYGQGFLFERPAPPPLARLEYEVSDAAVRLGDVDRGDVDPDGIVRDDATSGDVP